MSIRIVLCEDHPSLVALVREACAAAGHAVLGDAPDARAAALLAARLQPDVVVLDFSSADVPADAVRHFRRLAPGAAIVAYTGLAAEDLDAPTGEALAAHVLKSAPLAELVAQIERAARPG